MLNNQDCEIGRSVLVCPVCEKEHEVVLKKVKHKSIVKNSEIECDLYVYECEKTGEEFESGELLEINLKEIRDAYQKKNNL